jgi:VanZ family protein
MDLLMSIFLVSVPRIGPVGRWLIWTVYAVAWTKALLTPIHGPAGQVMADHPEAGFIFSKLLHVSAYALFALLSAWVQPPRSWRYLLLAFLACHALGTEFFQQFVETRTPSWRDVGLDLLGVGLGVLATWRCWRPRQSSGIAQQLSAK